MDFQTFKDWLVMGLLTCGVYVLWGMKTSMEQLTTHIAVVISRVDGHEKRIEKLEDKA